MGVSQTTALAPDSSKAKDSAASIFKILDRKPKIDSSSDEGVTLPTVTGDIELQHVSFRYPTRPNVEIFRDLSLTIPSGKVFHIHSFYVIRLYFDLCSHFFFLFFFFGRLLL